MSPAARYCAALGWLLVAVDPASAQWRVEFRRPQVEVGATYNGSWVAAENPWSLQRAQEWLGISLGASLGPREGRDVFTLHLSSNPRIGQGWTGPGPGSRLEDRRLSGAASLSASPVPGIDIRAGLDRQDGFFAERLGGYYTTEQSRWALEVRDNNPLLPMSVTYYDREELTELISGVAQRTLRLDRRVKHLRYMATNWKTRIHFDQRDVASVANGFASEYLQRRAGAANTLRWGKGSTLRNSLDYHYLQREDKSESFSYGTAVVLQHTQRFSSEYQWNDTRRWQAGTEGRLTLARVRLRHVNRTLGYSVDLAHRADRFGVFARRDLRLAPQVNMNHRFSDRIALTGSVFGGYSWRERRSEGAAFLYVLQEKQVFGEDGRIQLDNPFVDAGSVVLQSPDGSILYQEGFDYEVLETDPYWVGFALPGGRIDPGTEVSVDYRHDAIQAATARAVDYRASLNLEVGRLNLLYSHRGHEDLGEPSPLSGPTLGDMDSQQFAAQYRLGGTRLSMRLHAGLDRFRADGFSRDARVAAVTAGSRVSQTLSLSASARASTVRTDTETDSHTAFESEFRLMWRPARVLQSEFFASYNQWDGSNWGRAFTGLGSSMTLTLGGTHVSLRLDTVGRSPGQRAGESRETRAFLQFRQRF